MALLGKSQPDPLYSGIKQKDSAPQTTYFNTIRFKMSNAKIEAINNKIKLIIRLAYDFHSIQYLLDMVLLVCSDLAIALPNR